MKKQFFRVKQLADQTFLRADKSEVLNNEELHNGDQKIEYLRTALSAIVKKLPQGSQNNDNDKRNKKCLEYHLGHVFMEQSQKIDTGGFQDDDRHLFNNVVRESGEVENYVAKVYGECEKQIEDFVTTNIQHLVDHEFPNVLKHKRNLTKYILDRDSANNRYQSTKKEALKDDLEEADTKVEQTRDLLAYEMFNLLANENDWAGYILQILKCQRAYHETALKHLEEVIPKLEKKIGDSSVKRVYGISLEEHLRVTNKRIAYPLEICISILSKDSYLKEEGLFRIAGGSSRIKRLKNSIDAGCFSCDLIPEYEDVHVLASTLKLYLRELPEPLLTSKMYNDWMQSMQKPESERLEIVKKLIATLPRANRENLSYLMNFLAKIARNPENKMNSSNIAIVIAPNLLWNKDEEANMNMGNCATINMLVELFIKEVDLLFPEDVSSLITIKIHDSKSEDEFVDTMSQRSAVEYHVSNENITDSPKINARRKKPVAPVPPMANKNEQEHERFQPSGASTLNRPKTKTSIGINTDNLVHNHNLVNLEGAKTAEHKVITQPATPVLVSKAKPVQQVIAQNTNCDNKNYTTTVTHQIKPVAAPRSIETNRNIPNKPDIMSKSATEFPDVSLRKPEVAAKPEIPARPVSLQKRISVDTNLDLAPHRTQCSVYSVANKQQPCYVNVAIRNDKYQPGHDNQIAEKERFLGHIPVLNSDKSSAKPEKSDTTKSNENLGDLGERVNGNMRSTKPSHVRARSDGNLVDLSDGHKTPPSPKSLNKPTQPPPPPPAALKKESDSTDL